MNDLVQIIKELISYTSEEEWFEFKENWYDVNGIGEYISSLSNTAAMLGKEYAYLIWGVNNDTHEIVGTKFDYHQDVKKEPLEHYLARQITPDVAFSFHEVPVNRKLSDIFLQLHISERSGRGVPKITAVYGKDVFEFRENSIVVTIPFHYFSPDVGNKVGNKATESAVKLNPTRQRIIEEMRNNPNITQERLSMLIGIGKTAIENNISFLRKNGVIERMGSKKNGWWKIL